MLQQEPGDESYAFDAVAAELSGQIPNPKYPIVHEDVYYGWYCVYLLGFYIFKYITLFIRIKNYVN
jgi:hypothetical protein